MIEGGELPSIVYERGELPSIVIEGGELPSIVIWGCRSTSYSDLGVERATSYSD